MEIPLGQTGPTIAGVEWPMMSRTMTHVSARVLPFVRTRRRSASARSYRSAWLEWLKWMGRLGWLACGVGYGPAR